MYWIEISTHRKNIRLHTSKNDGEPFAWDIQLDTKNGTFTIEDNDEGYFFYDAKKRHFKMHNKDKTYSETEYEHKFKNQGIKIKYLKAIKKVSKID
jgi:hypothetical protein